MKCVLFLISEKDDWKKFEKNNLTIALNLLYNNLAKDYFANNLAEGIQKIKCKTEHDNKKCEMCGIN